MYPRFLLLLLVLWTCAASARAGTPTWVEVRSPHFDVMTEDNAKQAVHLADQFERMRAVFHTLFPKTNIDAPAPILVIAVKGKTFESLEPQAYLAKGQLHLAGYFMPAQDSNYILLRLDNQQEHPLSVIYHEYTHYMLRGASDWLPLWLNEGLASFFQTTEFHEKDVALGEVNANEILFLRQKSLIPLSVLFQVDRKSPYYHNEDKGSVFYAESWALVHYLEVEDHKTHHSRLGDYADRLSNRQDPLTAATAAFGDLNQLQNKLSWYIAQGSFQYFRVDPPPAPDPASYQVSPVTQLQADARRAEFLAHNGRIRDARALLDTVLQQEPENASACETMGYMAFREHDIPAARQWFSKAVRADSHSFLTHYYYAVMSMQDAAADEAPVIESSLKTAIQLNPAFAASYDALASYYGSRHEHLGEAHMMNIRASELEPGNLQYRLNTANILLQSDRPEDALRVLRKAASVATTPDQQATVSKEIAQVEQYRQPKTGVAGGSPAIVTTTVVNRRELAHLQPTGITGTLPQHPEADPSAPKREAQGVIHGVRCGTPAVLELQLEGKDRPQAFYSNNFYKLEFSAANYTPEGEIHPCSDLEGAKAHVVYLETADKTTAGQLISVELSH